MAGFDLYRAKFDGIHALCFNRERVANKLFESFVSSISEIHKGLIVTAIAISASYDSILKLEFVRIKRWLE